MFFWSMSVLYPGVLVSNGMFFDWFPKAALSSCARRSLLGVRLFYGGPPLLQPFAAVPFVTCGLHADGFFGCTTPGICGLWVPVPL